MSSDLAQTRLIMMRSQQQLKAVFSEILSQDMGSILYHICVNRPPVVHKKFTVSRWWFIEFFSTFCPKSPKKGTFGPKKWWFISILYWWQFNKEWRSICMDMVIGRLARSANHRSGFWSDTGWTHVMSSETDKRYVSVLADISVLQK